MTARALRAYSGVRNDLGVSEKKPPAYLERALRDGSLVATPSTNGHLLNVPFRKAA